LQQFESLLFILLQNNNLPSCLAQHAYTTTKRTLAVLEDFASSLLILYYYMKDAQYSTLLKSVKSLAF